MRKKKVLISAYACNPSSSLQLHPGEDTVGWRLVEQIRRHHRVWVITHSYNQEAVSKAQAKGSLKDVQFIFLHLPLKLRALYCFEIGQRIYNYLWQIFAWKKAKELNKKICFDVTHHITFNNDWIPSFIGAFLSVPFIWGPIGGGQKTPKRFFLRFSRREKIADLTRLTAQWIGRHLLYSRKRLLRKAKAILVCNRETEEKITEKYRNKTFYFPVNGISSDQLKSALPSKKHNPSFTILTAGRLVYWKNFRMAIEVFKSFHDHVPQSELKIIGDGPEFSGLKKLVGFWRLLDKVHFIRWLPQHELFMKMQESDVFLYTSLREGGGAVVVEAMANGVPVICLDTAGPGFHIQNNWGIKIEPKNPEYVIHEMVKALEYLYKNKDLRERMGRAARERAERFYVWDRLGERLQKIYEKVLN